MSRRRQRCTRPVYTWFRWWDQVWGYEAPGPDRFEQHRRSQ